MGPTSTACGTTLTIRRRSNPKVVKLFPGSELCSEPSRLLSAARPGLGRLLWISILREHLRVRTPFARRGLFRCVIRKELFQSLLKLAFFSRYFARQNGCDRHVQS